MIIFWIEKRMATLRVEAEEVRGRMAAEAGRRDRAKLEAADILGSGSIRSRKIVPQNSSRESSLELLN